MAEIVAQHLLKPLSARVVGVVLAVVPFAEQTGAIAGISQSFRDRDFFAAHQFVTGRNAPSSGSQRIATGQQTGPSRRAQRADKEAIKPNGLGCQTIQHRRLQHRIAMSREIAVTLIVGDHEQHIRSLSRETRSNVASETEHNEQSQQMPHSMTPKEVA